MAKLPHLSGPEVVRKLKRLGLEESHRKGSHVILRVPITRAMVVVPYHDSKPVKTGTLHGILKQAGITAEQFADA